MDLSKRVPLRVRAIERFVRLYDAWEITEPETGKAEQAAIWRDQLAAMKTRSE
jgi:hypothetical protein